jgi:Tfp pilus assembly protein PilN
MKKQDMNLLESYQKLNKLRENKGATGRIYIMIFIGTLLIASAYYFTLFIQNNALKQNIKDIENYLASPQVVDRSVEAERLNADIKKLEDILKEVQNAQNIFDLQPKFSSQTMNLLLAERPGTVRFNAVSFTGDAITLDISGTRVYSVSDYVMRLRRLDVFQEVQYSGYDLVEGVYNSNVVIILKGGK